MRTEGARLRVLMLITNLGQGGAERVFHDHATAFAELRMTVEQAVFAGDYDDAYQTQLPLHQLRTSAWLSWLGPLGRLLGRALALRRLVASRQFDVVVSHMDGANWVNCLSASCAAKVLVVHGSVMHDLNQRGWRQWLRMKLIIPALYRRAEVTVAVSEGIKRELVNLGIESVEAIPNFFDIVAIRRASIADLPAEAVGLFDGSDVLVTSGRLTAQKNQLELLHLYADMKATRSELRLAILGDGERRNELLDACRKLGLRARHPWPHAPSADAAHADVWFLGYQKNPFAFLSRARLFLFPSLWEGFPLALCEAMACGVPVLSADCPTGPREILAPDTDPKPMRATVAEFTKAGVLLPMLENDATRKAWANAALRLLETPVERQRLIEGGFLAIARLDRELIVYRWQEMLQRASGMRE